MSVRAGFIAAVVAASMTMAGCSVVSPPGDDVPVTDPVPPTTTGAPLDGSASPSTPPTTTGPVFPNGATGLARFYRQRVTWTGCEQIFECTTVRVPLDYAKPDGATITLSVIRRPADDQSARLGSLIVNPGGPGGSGIAYAENASTAFDQTLLDRFDIVGFDPRGVGSSTPVECLSDSELDTFLASDPDPDTRQEINANTALLRDFGAQCQRRSGDLLAHVSTKEAARDIDILRALVGDKKVNYFGSSYGTYLGATYANLFPRRVGRMVLDGAIDPSLSARQLGLGQARGFQTALEAYVRDCVTLPRCPLGSSVDAALQTVKSFLEQVDASPLPGDGDRQLTEGLALLGIIYPLYSKGAWPLLTSALTAALSGDGRQLLVLADAYAHRGPTGYYDNADQVIAAVNCLDHPWTDTVRQVRKVIPRYERATPVFGRVFAWMEYSCSQWPVKPQSAAKPLRATGAAPILVVGTTRDPATPYAGAVALAGQLDSGVLLSRNGDGHLAYRSGNPCIDETIDSYLVDGTVPPDGKRC